MKKLSILLFALLTCSIAATAQTSKGNVMIGGHFMLNIPTDDDNGADIVLSTKPAAGYFFADNAVLGLSIPISGTSGDGYSNSTMGLVPFFRYYFSSGNLYFFPEVGVGMVRYGSSRDTNEGRVSNSRSEAAGSLGVGMAYFLTDHVSIEGLFSYQGEDFINPLFVTGGGVNFSIGIQAYLRK